MKITFILPYASMSGGIRVIAIYAKRLQEKGHEVVVISVPKPAIPLKRNIKFLLSGKAWCSATPGPSYFDNMNVEHRVLETYRPITNGDVPDADIVIATWWETAYWVNSLNLSKGSKFYFMQDYGASGQELEKIIPTWSLPLHKITIAQWLVDLIHSHTDRLDVDLVLNAVDFTHFHTPPRHKQSQPTAGFLYRSSHSKGADIVFAAFKEVIKQKPNLKLIAFGPEPTPDFRHNNFQYIKSPPEADLPSLYASCDMWLFPSRIEGFGLPILEAMACRTPVIATQSGVAPELVNTTNGILLTDLSHNRMAQAIHTMIDTPNPRWQAISQGARKTVEQYSWDDATNLFEKVIVTSPKQQTRLH